MTGRTHEKPVSPDTGLTGLVLKSLCSNDERLAEQNRQMENVRDFVNSTDEQKQAYVHEQC